MLGDPFPVYPLFPMESWKKHGFRGFIPAERIGIPQPQPGARHGKEGPVLHDQLDGERVVPRDSGQGKLHMRTDPAHPRQAQQQGKERQQQGKDQHKKG